MTPIEKIYNEILDVVHEVINAGNANTQRIIDTLNAHWKDEQALQIQDLKFQLSQERQNSLLLNRLGGNGCTCLSGCGQ